MGTTYSKPAVRQAWAQDASGPIDIADPGDGFVGEGWQQSSTPPQRGYWNWILYWVSSAVRYFCQQGIPNWDVSETYSQGSVTVGDDGQVYQSLANTNIGNTPSTSPTEWGPLKNYVVTSAMNSAISTALAAYVTLANFNSTLANYATTAAVNTLLGAYVKTTTLTSTLASYLTVTSAQNTYATLAQAALLAPKANPIFSGSPQSPTPPFTDRSSAIATTTFVGNVAQTIAQAVAAPGATFGTTGWRQNADGSIDQWGLIANGGNGPTPVSFPKAFPNACWNVQQSCVGNQGTLDIQSTPTKTGFVSTNGATGGSTFWRAIGF